MPMYIDEAEYPKDYNDVISKIEHFINTSDDELGAYKLKELLEECGVHVERGWYGHRSSYFIPTVVDVDIENDFLYDQWADGLDEENY